MIKSMSLRDLREQLVKSTEKLTKVRLKGVEIQVLEMDLTQDDLNRPWFGRYMVEGSKGFYDIVCGQTARKEFFISCGCRAGRENRPCYHAARVIDFHIDRVAPKPENAPYLKPSSGKKTTPIGKIRV